MDVCVCACVLVLNVCFSVFAGSVSGELDSVILLLFLMLNAQCSAQRDIKEGCDCFDLMPNVLYNNEKPLKRYSMLCVCVCISYSTLANAFDMCNSHGN